MKFLLLNLAAIMAISPCFKLSEPTNKSFKKVVDIRQARDGKLSKAAGIFDGIFDFGFGNNDSGSGGDGEGGNGDGEGNGTAIPDFSGGFHTIYDDLFGNGGFGSGNDDGDNSGGIEPHFDDFGEHTHEGGIWTDVILPPHINPEDDNGTSYPVPTAVYNDSLLPNSTGSDYMNPIVAEDTAILNGWLCRDDMGYCDDWFSFTIDRASRLAMWFAIRPTDDFCYELYSNVDPCPQLIYSSEDAYERNYGHVDLDNGEYLVRIFIRYFKGLNNEKYKLCLSSIENDNGDWVSGNHDGLDHSNNPNGNIFAGNESILGPHTEFEGVGGTDYPEPNITYHDDLDAYDGLNYNEPIYVESDSAAFEGKLFYSGYGYYEDWFLFSLKNASEYKIWFDNRVDDDYKYEVYKQTAPCPQLVYSSDYADDGNHGLVNLKAGSYFIRIFSACPNSATSDEYSLFTYSKPIEEFYTISSLLGDNNLLVWEADIVPSSINHWDGNKNLFYSCDFVNSTGYYPKRVFGCADYMFRNANDLRFVDYSSNNIYLDSVLYMFDPFELDAFGTALGDFAVKAVDEMEKQETEELRVEKAHAVFDVVKGVIELTLMVASTVVGGAPGFACTVGAKIFLTAYEIYSYADAINSVLCSFCNMLDSIETTKPSEVATVFWNLAKLQDSCFYAAEHNKGVFIPRQAKIQKLSKNDNCNAVWQTGYFPTRLLNEPNPFVISKYDVIKNVQEYDNSLGTQSGTFKTYPSYRNFVDETGFTFASGMEVYLEYGNVETE